METAFIERTFELDLEGEQFDSGGEVGQQDKERAKSDMKECTLSQE